MPAASTVLLQVQIATAFNQKNIEQAFVIYEWNPQPTGWSWQNWPVFAEKGQER